MTPAERYRLAEEKRLRAVASNPEASDFERADAARRLASMADSICQFCELPVSTHVRDDMPRNTRGHLTELGDGLCPVVVSLGKAGAGPWERLYRPPTSDEAAAWRASNKAGVALTNASARRAAVKRVAERDRLEARAVELRGNAGTEPPDQDSAG